MLPELSEKEARERIARRAARELKDGDVVNLGIGIPQLVPDYLPKEVHLVLQTENGVINAAPSENKEDLRIIDAGGRPVAVLPGGALISAELSFAIMRGGHIDVTILGALEVDEEGNLANWMIPRVRIPGMGGAMDIVTGAKKVFVATRHFDKEGKCKLVRKCTLPLTGHGVADMIITEFCVIRCLYGRMTLTELASDVRLQELLERTEMELFVSSRLTRTPF